ncbi:MAG: rhodanese-like domain-containing protein [Planctomycetes bacterium]|nr:rhodanese-like domain-containing protein [Planctomycetota bacterium]
MRTIMRDELKRRLDHREDVVLVEVLAPEYFDEYHLPGAINVPMDESFEENIQDAIPQKDRPVVVYCYSAECSASSEAAARMADLGYTDVFHYAAGKTDWHRAGYPVASGHAGAHR